MLVRVIPRGLKTRVCISSFNDCLVIASTTFCRRMIPSPEYAYLEPGSKCIFNWRAFEDDRKFGKPLVWLSSILAVIRLTRGSFARSLYAGYSGSGFGKY